MKKLVLSLLVAVSLSVYARNFSVYGKTESGTDMKNSVLEVLDNPDGFFLKYGKMMMVNNGKYTIMFKNVTLPEGTVVMSNGYFIKKGGPKIKLKEGEFIDMEGNLTKTDTTVDPKTTSDKNMNDSTMNTY